ncbi:transcription termination factor 3, mitochondrial-like, partial [Argonauta hians]
WCFSRVQLTEKMLLNSFLRTFKHSPCLLSSYRQLVRPKVRTSLVCHYCQQKTAKENNLPIEDEKENQLASKKNYEYFKSFIDSTEQYKSSKDVPFSNIRESSNVPSKKNYEYFKSFIDSTEQYKTSKDVPFSNIRESSNVPSKKNYEYFKSFIDSTEQYKTSKDVPFSNVRESSNVDNSYFPGDNECPSLCSSEKQSETSVLTEKQEHLLHPQEENDLYKPTIEQYTDNSAVSKESYSKESDSTLADIPKRGTVYRPMFIRKEPVYNLAFYVKESKTLQQLVQLGVDLSRVEKIEGAGDILLKRDFNSDIQPYLNFLMNNGVSRADLGNCITKNPLIFEADLNLLESNIGYLQSKKFSNEAIGRLITVAPRLLLIPVSSIDGKLGFYQKFFKLSGDEVREIVTRQPKLITYNIKVIKDIHFEMKEFFGFTNLDLQKIFLSFPKVFLSSKKLLSEKFEYLHHEMGLNHADLVNWPGIFRSRLFRIKERHKFLKHLKRDQFDCSKENYVSLKALVTKSDKEFCMNVAKSSTTAFNQFLKTL